MKKQKCIVVFLFVLGMLFAQTPIYADDGQNIAYAVDGTTRIVSSLFAIPKAVIQDSGRVLFPFGIVTGVVRGTVGMLGGLLGGAVEVAQGSAPYAKYAALAL